MAAVTGQIIYSERLIRKSLDTTTTPAIKQESALSAKAKTSNQQKPWPQCSPGWHNPACTGHTQEQ
ncbi:hypothetical protein VP01_3945g2 [Puccinia sorghi]|uniref:Uncharacterized protein n=1 Tax=Puccinia sorghi TaxID=27349 RepID=A0A0L6USE8_9BASI|nr:hypothetical protein VP01_3945g2 [Puccinia sorghi]